MTYLDAQGNQNPTPAAALLFRLKVLAFQTERAIQEFRKPEPIRHTFNQSLTGKPVLGESRSPLWTEHEQSERALILGKIQNLRLAVRRLNGVEVSAGNVFSFWKQIGRVSRWKGFAAGRELREGCLIPSIGGGLCQLSNALYDAALKAGFEIVERHAHSKTVPGSLAEWQRDATVFWNYVDLRFRHSKPFRIEAELTSDALVVRLRGDSTRSRPQRILISRAPVETDVVHSCSSCNSTGCFRHDANVTGNHHNRTAYLLDEYWPEFDRYCQSTRRARDLMLIPLNGEKFGKPNYAWSTSNFDHVKQHPFFVVRRSLILRKLSQQGVRQKTILLLNQELANRYASHLPVDVTHVIVAQSLLPHLWLRGDLGGRTFDVLMTSLPVKNLHERLDAAFSLHPESPTLADFRSAPWLAAAEADALRAARRVITPHRQIAELFSEKSVLLDWILPNAKQQLPTTARSNKSIVFPAATLGRKGIYELRRALDGLNVELTIAGPVLESAEFWNDIKVRPLPPESDWLAGASAVVLPSIVEHNPRRLLEAVARGVPVIASRACGLEGVRGVRTVATADSCSLRLAIQEALVSKK